MSQQTDDARIALAQQQAMNNPGGMSISNYEIVELTIPAGTTGRVNFNPQAKLRNQADQIVWIQNLEVFPDTVYGHSQFKNNIVGMPAAEIPKIVLSLYVSGWEKIHFFPISKLIHSNDGGSPFQAWMQYFNTMEDVQWESSYIQFNAAAGETDYVIPFGVTYIKANVS